MGKHKRNDIYIPQGIIDTPEPIDNFFFKNTDQEIVEINDEYIRIKKNRVPPNFWFIVYGIAFLIFGLPLLFSLLNQLILVSTIFSILFLSVLLYLTCITITESGDKYPFECEFNRLNRTLTYSSSNKFKKKKTTILFTNCEFELLSSHSKGRPTTRSLSIINTLNQDIIIIFTSKHEGLIHKNIDDIIKHHSFLQWYMDRNRPLPSGTMLDPYREKDYLRRKNNGFEKPLIPSMIDIADIDECIYQADIESDNIVLALLLLKP